MKLFSVSYYFTNDGYDSASGTPFYTACTQILVVEEAHVTLSRFLLSRQQILLSCELKNCSHCHYLVSRAYFVCSFYNWELGARRSHRLPTRDGRCMVLLP